jgi:hypothetical protein
MRKSKTVKKDSVRQAGKAAQQAENNPKKYEFTPKTK